MNCLFFSLVTLDVEQNPVVERGRRHVRRSVERRPVEQNKLSRAEVLRHRTFPCKQEARPWNVRPDKSGQYLLHERCSPITFQLVVVVRPLFFARCQQFSSFVRFSVPLTSYLIEFSSLIHNDCLFNRRIVKSNRKLLKSFLKCLESNWMKPVGFDRSSRNDIFSSDIRFQSTSQPELDRRRNRLVESVVPLLPATGQS